MRTVIIILVVSCFSTAQTPKRITGKYSNPTLGYEVTIPEGLAGESGGQAGPEGGIGVSLSSGGAITVFGEANRLGWRAPIDGIRHSLGAEKCDSGRRQATGFGRMGRITATKGTQECGDRLLDLLLAFRPGGGTIYWITLRTTVQKRVEDEAVFNKLAATFQLTGVQ